MTFDCMLQENEMCDEKRMNSNEPALVSYSIDELKYFHLIQQKEKQNSELAASAMKYHKLIYIHAK